MGLKEVREWEITSEAKLSTFEQLSAHAADCGCALRVDGAANGRGADNAIDYKVDDSVALPGALTRAMGKLPFDNRFACGRGAL